MNRLHIIGKKNSGKTTLIVELVDHWTRSGLQVGTIKHTHHHHELDIPGKDSFKHRHAGASPVGILSPDATAIFCRTEPSGEGKRYDQMAPMFESCDLVLVEGDSQSSATRVEVWRVEVGAPPYAASDATIRALITGDSVAVDIPMLKRKPIEQLATQLLKLAGVP